MIDQLQDALIAFSACIGFWLLFSASWFISLRYGQHTFKHYTSNEKAEWCTRICSTVHASIVIPGVVACLVENDWSTDDIAFTSPRTCRTIFSITIGYFLQDLGALIYWHLNYWQAFVAHHIIGVLPYVINNFVPGCHCGNYVLAMFLLVEIPTLPLNCVGIMDQIGMRKSTSRYIAFITMYALWFLARIILPIYLLVVLYEIIIPTWYVERSAIEFGICVLPSTVSANIISFFCFYVFLMQLSVDLFKECMHSQDGDKKGGLPPSDSPTRGSVHGSLEGGSLGQSPVSSRPFSTYGAVAGGALSHDSNGDSSSDDEVYGITQMFRKKSSESSRKDTIRHRVPVHTSDEKDKERSENDFTL